MKKLLSLPIVFLTTFLMNWTYLAAGKSLPIDPIKFELSTNAAHILLDEEFEIRITAKYITINPNLIYVFGGANAFTLKLVMPAGFVQTGGTYSGYIGTELTASKPSVSYIVRGKFTQPSKDGTFQLLRSHQSANIKSDFILVGQLAFSAFGPAVDSTAQQTARIATITQEYMPYMNLDQFRQGAAATSKVVYISDGNKSGVFRLDSTDTSTSDDNSMILVHSGKRFKRFFEHVTPEMFGAIANDDIDDAVAIQKALDYVIQTKGLRVVFSAGTYMIGSTLTLKTINGAPTYNYNIMLTGAGLGTTVLKDMNSITGNLLQMISGQLDFQNKNSRVIIRDLTLTANYADRCFYADYVSQLRLEDCRFNGGKLYTAQIGSDIATKNYSTYITRCYFGGYDESHALNQGTLLLKHGLFIAIDQMETDGGRVGIHFVNTAASIVSNSKIEGCKYAAILIEGTSNGEHRIANNYVSSYGGYDANGQFSGEINGVYVKSSGGNNFSNNITGNIIRVSPSNSLPVIMKFNNLSGTLAASSNGHIINGSSGAQGYLQNIFLAESKILVQMISGMFSPGETFTLATNGANAKIESITTNASYGIRLEGTGSSSKGSNNVSANHLTDQTDYGIYVSSPGNSIIGNTVSGKTAIYINRDGHLIGNHVYSIGGVAINNDGGLASLVNNTILAGTISGTEATNYFATPVETLGSNILTANWGTGNKYISKLKVNGTEVFSLSNYGPTSTSLVGQNGSSVWLGTSTGIDYNAATLGVKNQRVVMKDLPTSSVGLESGMLWRDAANGNVIKIVP